MKPIGIIFFMKYNRCRKISSWRGLWQSLWYSLFLESLSVNLFFEMLLLYWSLGPPPQQMIVSCEYCCSFFPCDDMGLAGYCKPAIYTMPWSPDTLCNSVPFFAIVRLRCAIGSLMEAMRSSCLMPGVEWCRRGVRCQNVAVFWRVLIFSCCCGR